MKLLTIAVPSYNSEAYLETCLGSLLAVGGDAVEILVVDDGSKDQTAAIADRYAQEYPGRVVAIHQENGGHGEAVNAGLRHATGLYFKVVDSDDWLDPGAFAQVCDLLRSFADDPAPVDLLVTNFVFEKVGVRHKKVMDYRRVLPMGRRFTWSEARPFRLGQYLMMHSLLYRTQVLRDSGLVLPKHTFYCDNLFVFIPLDFVHSLYYADVDFYRYFIGRVDQSVNETVMLKRIDQQLRVNTLMVTHQRLDQVPDPTVRQLKFHQLEIVTAISSMFLIRSGTPEHLALRDQLWDRIEAFDPALGLRLRKRFLGRLTRGQWGRWVAVTLYGVAHRLFGFN